LDRGGEVRIGLRAVAVVGCIHAEVDDIRLTDAAREVASRPAEHLLENIERRRAVGVADPDRDQRAAGATPRASVSLNKSFLSA